MNERDKLKNILQLILVYYIKSGNKANIVCRISEQLEALDHDTIYDFLKWHKLLTILPPNTTLYNHEDIKATKIRNQKLIELSKLISLEFSKNNICFCFLKGISLITSIYPDISKRSFNDIDILVSKKDLDNAESIIKSMGFVHGDIIDNKIIPASKSQIKFQKHYTHELYQLVNFIDGEFYEIDINHLFSWKGIEHENTILILDQITNEITYSSCCSLPILSHNYQFIHLCCHFYNEAMCFALDMNYDGTDPREIRLFRLYDICILICQNNIDPSVISAICLELGINHKISYVLSLIKYIFEDTIDISSFWTLFKSIELNSENNYYLRSGKLAEWPISFNDRIFCPSKRNNIKLKY